MAQKVILLNKMFGGRYATLGENVVHEVINLFKADDEKNYIFITPGSNIPAYYVVESVLFVKHVTQRTAEVIALAKGLKRADLKDEDMQKIKYQGAPLADLFRGNIWQPKNGGAKTQDSNPLVTYIADEVWLPKSKQGERMLISLGEEGYENACILPDQGRTFLFSESMRWYLSESKWPENYRTISSLISTEEKWEADSEKRKLVNNEAHNRTHRQSFLEIVRKEDDELAFSNLLAYYLTYRHDAFASIANRLFSIKTSGQYEVLREYKHIDILVRDERHIIVVENKIGAGILERKDGRTQLDDYHDAAKAIAEDEELELRCFLFAPDYKVKELEKYAEPNKFRASTYTIVPYSKLFDTFEEHKTLFEEDRWRFDDFLRGLKRHTVKTPADHDFELMRLRFLARIHQLVQ